VLVRIHQASDGNPFSALEVARALGAAELPPREPLPVPEDVRVLVRRRIERLPRARRQALLRIAALAQPTSSVLGPSLQPALRSELVQRLPDGRITFTHPLYASAVYEAAAPEERRRIHRELATLVTDIEERARHLAIAATGADEDVAAELDTAAAQARSRGAPEMAADLQERALELTPAHDRSAADRRALAAAEDWFHSGALARARSLLTARLDHLADRGARAGALRLLAHVCFRETSVSEAIDLLRAAAEAAGDDPELRVPVELDLAFAFVSVSLDHEAARPHAEALLAYAERLGEPGQLAEALAVVTMVDFLLGRGVDEARLERALALEDPERRVPAEFRPTLIAGFLAFYTGRFDRARSLLYPLHGRLHDRGAEADLPILLGTMTWLECSAGDLPAARMLAEEALEAASLTESETMTATSLAFAALVDAHAGAVESCRERIEAALEASVRSGYGLATLWTSAALGNLELSLGDASAARRAFAPLTQFVEAHGLVEPIRAFFLPDAIEALIELGDLERAGRLTDMLVGCGRRLDRPWALALGGRCTALLLAARGDVSGALETIEPALLEHERVPMPLELGRTLLVKGQIERRARRKASAKKALEQALSTFEAIGTPLWAAKARSELARVGAHVPPDELTETERRIVELAAAGLTNRAVAAQLFISPKTVEANLARSYRKLGIHSRAQLALRIAGALEPAEP
jgi:DNA-binding CsgD family transcriptional regulator